MPHPNNVVSISTTAQTGVPPLETKQQAALIGHRTAANKPTDIEFNRVYNYSDPAAVATDFGDGSDLHIGAKQVRAEQADTFSVVLLERTETTETLGDSDTTVTGSGTVSTVPMAGVGGEVTITVDGNATDESAVTTSPPVTEDGSQPAPGEAVYNADTGEVNIGDDTSGSGAGIEVTYETLSWTQGLQSLRDASVDIVHIANEKYDRSNVGDLDELHTWADAYDVTVPQPYVRGTTLGDGQGPDSVALEQDLAQDIGAFVPSKFALPIANSSTDDVGSAYVGRLAVEDPWYDPYLKTVDLQSPAGRYTPGNIGAPETPGTFEGGRDGNGMSNVLLASGGTTLSNSLTTAGSDSPYRYLDIPRSEAFIKVRARDAIRALFRDNTVRFDADGQNQLEGALNEELQPLVGERDSPFTNIDVRVPEAVELTPSTRLNRIWQDIEVVVDFAPTVHRAAMTIVTRLANETTTAETTA